MRRHAVEFRRNCLVCLAFFSGNADALKRVAIEALEKRNRVCRGLDRGRLLRMVTSLEVVTQQSYSAAGTPFIQY
jgi:hypothetical protein